MPGLLLAACALPALAADLPEVGPTDRVRVDVPDWPGAEATSATGSVLLAPPPAGTPYRVEAAPDLDDTGVAGTGAFVAEEAIAALGAAAWHERGITGQGVKVAVFDVQWFGAEVWADELGPFATHDCQAHRSCDVAMDTLRPRYSWEEGVHGIACAEVIRDLAPDAEIHLVRVNGETTLENAVEWAIREQVDIVSMSMSFFHNSFHDGTGPIVDAARRLAEGGVLLVNSAGNYATEHWDGTLRDDDGDDVLEFPWGEFFPMWYGSGVHSAAVTWDQFGRCGDTDLDVIVYERDGDVIGRAEATQDPEADACSPTERVRFDSAEKDWVWLQVIRRRGEPDVRVAVYARGGDAWQTTPGGLADPATAPTAFTVGAVRAAGYLDNGAESFSSTGPTHAGVDKPDIAGPDGLTTGTYGTLGFYGTSASTPAIAGAVALALSADPGATAEDAARRLQANALDGPAVWDGPDGSLGAGKARLWGERPDAGACGGGRSAALAPFLLMLTRFRRRGA